MDKQQAIAAMKEGKKVTHTTYFTDKEWVSSNKTGSYFTLEDNVTVPEYEFWQYRQGDDWETGWEEYKDKQSAKSRTFVVGLDISEEDKTRILAALKDKDVIFISSFEDMQTYSKEIDALDEEHLKRFKETIVIEPYPRFDIDVSYTVQSKDDYNKKQQKLRNRYNQRRKH